jgi:hypothetical protein
MNGKHALADQMADSFRDDADQEMKHAVLKVMTPLIEELGESVEAWRGAEKAMAFYGQAILAVSDVFESDKDRDAVGRLASLLTAAFLDQPAARALRRSA